MTDPVAIVRCIDCQSCKTGGPGRVGAFCGAKRGRPRVRPIEAIECDKYQRKQDVTEPGGP